MWTLHVLGLYFMNLFLKSYFRRLFPPFRFITLYRHPYCENHKIPAGTSKIAAFVIRTRNIAGELKQMRMLSEVGPVTGGPLNTDWAIVAVRHMVGLTVPFPHLG